MNRTSTCLRRLAALAALCGFALAAAADEVRVLAAAPLQPVLAAVAPVFQKRTGHTLALVNAPAGTLAERIRAGEDFDLAVLPQPLLETLGKEGAVSDGSIIPLARGRGDATVFAGAVSTSASSSQAALSLLILLASEETQAVLRNNGLSLP